MKKKQTKREVISEATEGRGGTQEKPHDLRCRLKLTHLEKQ